MRSAADLEAGGESFDCAAGVGCTVGSDCRNGSCALNTHTCNAPTCTDGIQNGSETAIDCGGSCSPCPRGQACLISADCTSGVCTGFICQ